MTAQANLLAMDSWTVFQPHLAQRAAARLGGSGPRAPKPGSARRRVAGTDGAGVIRVSNRNRRRRARNPFELDSLVAVGT